jgi:hypothetical protein
LPVAFDEVLPLAALRVGPLDRLRRGGIPGAQRGQHLVGFSRPRVVEEILVANARELRHQVRLARSPARSCRLDGQHPADRLRFTAKVVRSTCGLQELPQLLGVHARIALDLGPQLLPRLAVIRIVLQQPEGALDRLRAHPSPGGFAPPTAGSKHSAHSAE